MAHITADRVRDTSTSTSTGNFTVSGTAPTGFRTLSAVLSASDTFYYAIQGQGTSEWEVGLGTYSSTNVFARTTVLSSSNSGSAVNFSAGTKDVFLTLAASKTTQADGSGNVGIGTSSPGNKLVTASSATNSKIEVQNISTAASTSKTSAIQFSGTDTVGTLKESGDIYVTPADNNYVGSNMLFYTRGSDVVAERARISAAGGFSVGTTTDPGAGYISDKIGNVRSVPQNSQTNGYTLVALDAGKHISITTGGVTVPASVFSIGDTVTIYNNSGSNQTITQGASVTLRQVGTASTGNRTLAQYGLCTILCVASNTFVITGGGLT
jgi:hypothetical protein